MTASSRSRGLGGVSGPAGSPFRPWLLCGHARPEGGGLAADGFLGPLSCICGWESGAVSTGVDRPKATSWEASILSKARGLGVVLTHCPVPRGHSPVKS